MDLFPSLNKNHRLSFSVSVPLIWPSFRLRLDLGRQQSLAFSLIAARKDRLWLSLVAVPLALTAVVLAGQFALILPLVALAWWWASQEWAWAWLVGIMEACWGIQWAYVGVYTLATYPEDRGMVAAGWIGYAALVACVAAVNRWRYHRRHGW